MKLYIEFEKCCGFGECVALAPDLFRMGDDNRAHLIGDGTVNRADEERARTAAFACPAEAIGVDG
ncbi:ferredoxin [Streptosporangium sp. NPDC049644]|uniref:ferredoxin n=1 Tax=Streptosporangium sp. NPDC049644 TaxID=3155507 RepID=UPI00342A4D23